MTINEQIELVKELIKDANQVARLSFMCKEHLEFIKKLNAILKTLEQVRDGELAIEIPVTGVIKC
jgi:Asp-tRNA(Asn)/Glu-tRNA(Gln) amidotransferase C subunit